MFENSAGVISWREEYKFEARHSSRVPVSRPAMNLSLYSIQAFIILDSEGHRVLAKYYNPKSHPQGESKEFQAVKEQKAFEKGLWQKTKKSGGTVLLAMHTPYQPDDGRADRRHHTL